MSVRDVSDETQTVINHAQKLAQDHQHSHLDTPHLFHALLIDSDAARDWLREFDHEQKQRLLEALSEEYTTWFSSDTEYPEPSELYFKAMRKAQDIAVKANSRQIEPSHLLAAIIELDSRLVSLLKQQGVEQYTVSIPIQTPLLNQLGRDLTELARKGELNQIVGREKETQQLIEVLLRQGKNSALLLGPPGVGKTAVVERLAQDIVSQQVPAKLKKVRLVELNVASLVAGTSYRGEFEERLLGVIKEIENSRDIIVVIDEFYTIIGAGETREGGANAAQILKPALARGELTCIGITTQEEYRKYIEKDQAFTRRFYPITVSEPSPEESLAILRVLAPVYEKHHHVHVQDATLQDIVKWADQYLTGRYFPDKAIDILTKAFSRAEIQKMEHVNSSLIADIIGELTGIPVGTLKEGARQKLINLEAALKASIIGQNNAVEVVASTLQLAHTGLRDPRRPKGVFLFVGPSGSGKTELARALAREMFGSEQALIRLDMSEYAEKINISRLIGAAPGYIGHDEPGQLTQSLIEHPYSVVLFDEVEKAHPDVFDLFLQLFDEGRLTDSHGRLVDGRHAVFIMTSNLGSTHANQRMIGFADPQFRAEPNSFEGAARAFFRPELLNRIDRIIPFRALDSDDLAEIANLEIQKLTQRLQEQKIRLTFENSICELVAEAAVQQDSGARGINRMVEEMIAIPLSSALIQNSLQEDMWFHLQVVDRRIFMERI